MAYGTTNKYIVYSVNASEIQVDNDNNRSLVRVWVDIWRTNTGYTTYGSGTVTVSCDGQTQSASITSSQKITSTAIRLCTFDFWVGHNSDGAKSAWISAVINHSQFSSNWNGYTHSLTTIPRSASITSCNSFSDEDNPSFSFSNPGNFDMETWLEPNPNGTHYFARKVSGTSGTYTFELTEEEKETLREQCTGKSCTIRVGLYSNGHNWVDYKDVTYTVINCDPEIQDLAYADVNDDIVAFTENNQLIVQGNSKLRIYQPSVYTKKNANFIDWRVQGNGMDDWYAKTQMYVDLDVVDSDSDIEVTVSVEDSRQSIVSETLKIKVLAYNQPTLSATAKRLNNYENETTLHAIGNITSLDEKNSMTIAYQYRAVSNSKEAFSNWVEIENDTDVITNFSKMNAYEIKFRLKDKMNEVTYTLILEKGTPMVIFDVNLLSTGINKFPTKEEALETDSLYYMGIQLLDFIFPVGTQIYNSNIDFDPNKIYTGTVWKRIRGVVLAGINELDENEKDYLNFNKESGTKIGGSSRQLRAWIGATHSDTSRIGYRASPTVPKIDFYTYSITGGNVISNTNAINHTTIVSDSTGNLEVSAIQPTQLTYIWERIE